MLYKAKNKNFNQLVSTPLLVDKLEPDNWDDWWNIWEDHSKTLYKTQSTPNGEVGYTGFNTGIEIWQGLDLFASDEHKNPWTCPSISGKKYFPKMFETIYNLRKVKKDFSFGRVLFFEEFFQISLIAKFHENKDFII